MEHLFISFLFRSQLVLSDHCGFENFDSYRRNLKLKMCNTDSKKYYAGIIFVEKKKRENVACVEFYFNLLNFTFCTKITTNVLLQSKAFDLHPNKNCR